MAMAIYYVIALVFLKEEMENYEIITKLGSGACGAVYLVKSHANGRFVISKLSNLLVQFF